MGWGVCLRMSCQILRVRGGFSAGIEARRDLVRADKKRHCRWHHRNPRRSHRRRLGLMMD